MNSEIRPVSLTRSIEEIIVCVDIRLRRNVGVRGLEIHGLSVLEQLVKKQ